MSSMSDASPILALAVIPRVTPQNPSTPPNKRRITPSAEHSTAKRSLVLSTPDHGPSYVGAEIPTDPFLAPKQLFPEASARVMKNYGLAGTPTAEDIWHARRVLLPVDLKDPLIDPLVEPVLSLLKHIFPDTMNVSISATRTWLSFNFKEFPSKPWPLTIGGLPVKLTTYKSGHVAFFPRAPFGITGISICEEFRSVQGNFSNAQLLQIAAETNSELKARCPRIRMTEIMSTCENFFYVILDNTANLARDGPKLPGRIAGRRTRYMLEKDMCRPLWADLKARRQIQPNVSTKVVDNTPYVVLRPGVCLKSRAFRDHGHPAHYITTSGVIVKNFAGDKFMTAAAHGIGEDETVYQTLPDGTIRSLGKAVHEITNTDVALIQLDPGVQFVNETFEDNLGRVPRFTRLLGEDPHETMDSIFDVYLDSPFTGRIDGVRMVSSVPIPDEPLPHAVYDWLYVGGMESSGFDNEPPDRICGSAIWNDEGVISGFFRYYFQEGPWAGFAVSVSAAHVVNAGYTLA